MKRCVGFFIVLLNTGIVTAQDRALDILVQQFRQYQSGNLQEKLFVHTDKTFYLAGETVWFKMYAVDASFHKPLTTSRIAYIEMLNKDLKPVIQTKISISNGGGSGSFILPGFLPSGNYIFRAYTSWMKNYPVDFFYEQSIRIVNTLKTTPTIKAEKWPSAIQFFPEGGNFVSGLPAKMAFKATDGEGKGLECMGIIVNQHYDTIAAFQSLHDGMGSFLMTPEKNTVYYAVLRMHDSLIKQKLPDVEANGFVMRVQKEGSGQWNITVKASDDFNNTVVYLLTQTRQLIKNAQAGKVIKGEVSFLIDEKDLGDL